LTNRNLKLREERYGKCARFGYPYAARSSLRYLERRGQSIESVTPTDLERYLDSRRLKGSPRPYPKQFRRMHRAAIKMLLREVCGRWPPAVQPTSPEEIEDRELVDRYDTWMKDLRGLSANTRRHGLAEARRLLSWMRKHEGTAAILSVADLDAYVAWCSDGRRRSGIVEMVSCVRGVLRHLHRGGLMPVDLSGEITGPAIYALEGIPSTIRAEDVQRALKALKQDRTALGRRDYAIWMLLTSYGLRAGEIKALKLSDIDWRCERLRIRHAKTGAYSELPLLRAPADALLDHLRYGRPATTARAVFLRAQAPYRALNPSTDLYGIVMRRLAAVDVRPTVRHRRNRCAKERPVALRFAR
jgi:site-specific recombinase XerD